MIIGWRVDRDCLHPGRSSRHFNRRALKNGLPVSGFHPPFRAHRIDEEAAFVDEAKTLKPGGRRDLRGGVSRRRLGSGARTRGAGGLCDARAVPGGERSRSEDGRAGSELPSAVTRQLEAIGPLTTPIGLHPTSGIFSWAAVRAKGRLWYAKPRQRALPYEHHLASRPSSPPQKKRGGRMSIRAGLVRRLVEPKEES
jgi:hypothetical protein